MKISIEPRRSILRPSTRSDWRFDASDVVVVGRVDFVGWRRYFFAIWVKWCQNGPKFDVVPSSGILGPTICFILWNKVSSFTVARSSWSAIRRVKLGQMMLKWGPKFLVLTSQGSFERSWGFQMVLTRSGARSYFAHHGLMELHVASLILIVCKRAKWHFWCQHQVHDTTWHIAH